MTLLRSIGLTCGLAATAFAQSGDEPVLFESFDPSRHSVLYRELSDHDLLEVVDEKGVHGSRALKTEYVGYERGSKRVVVREMLAQGLREATLCYDVKFDRDFRFVRGGKLHGLGPRDPITGGNEMKAKGWSARIMFEDEGALRTYIYCQDKSTKWGQSVPSDGFRFEREQYHAVCLYVKLNDPPSEANGLAQVYVDGKLVADHRDIQYRAVEGKETLIQQFMFSTFHGGHSPSWAPRDEEGRYTTVHAYFDNFGVYRGKHVRQQPGGDDR